MKSLVLTHQPTKLHASLTQVNDSCKSHYEISGSHPPTNQAPCQLDPNHTMKSLVLTHQPTKLHASLTQVNDSCRSHNEISGSNPPTNQAPCQLDPSQ
ncbi:hypothetical protein RRG08_059887 [Elysia crispata]|uniref:Uncharacterized protein n=1 Tax=Elysia crispata TaxID=231223 RepID=A0AAE1DG49_9GAST|nr:hypothetical protein RRG08_059887 [Elysia crispata]